jgi:hypothetical protein
MFSKRARLWLGLVIAAGLLSLASACGKKEEGPSEGPPGRQYESKNDEGAISGKIAFEGTAPEPKKIDTSADAVCGQKNPNLTTEEWVVKDGKLANTFVYIKDGTLADGTKIGDTGFPVPASAVVLDQNGCHYVPHVFGIMTNQKLSVTNSDPTQHNIHPQPKNNEEWNQTQPNGAPPIEKTFKRAEVLIPVKCNQHPWMKAYIGVLKHPFFAVSKADGSYEIKGVPPGTYTVAAWHEGGATGTEKTIQVTVAAKGSATADFSFSPSAAMNGQKSSLEMLPAIEFPMLGRH